MGYNGQTDESAWNLSSATLQRLDGLMLEASFWFRRGSLHKFFMAWKSVSMNAIFKFNEIEKKNLKKLEMLYKEDKRLNYKWAYAEKYSEKVLQYLHKYGMLLPSKQDSVASAY